MSEKKKSSVLVPGCLIVGILIVLGLIATPNFVKFQARAGDRSEHRRRVTRRPAEAPDPRRVAARPPSAPPVNSRPRRGPSPANAPAPRDMFFRPHGVNPFVDTDGDNVSVFGLDVDTASYSIARNYILSGHLPPENAVRPEEFINYFDYGYKASLREDFTIDLEGVASPFCGDDYRLLRIGIKAKEPEIEERKRAILTLVVDVSGSMEKGGRLEMVKRSIKGLVGRLGHDDRVGVVVFSHVGREILDPVPARDRRRIIGAIEGLVPGGNTNAMEGLNLGYRMADRSYEKGSINRVILFSDGVANRGQTSAKDILEWAGHYSSRGINLTTVGVGMGNYNDAFMEELADNGNGNYVYMDTLDESDRVFDMYLEGTLDVIGMDARARVEFNPDVVGRYRLIGYENRHIKDRDFRDRRVDAGEVGAGHEVTALYEIKLRHRPPREWAAAVMLRTKNPEQPSKVTEQSREIMIEDFISDFQHASPETRLAASVAEFSEILGNSYWARGSSLEDVSRVIYGLPWRMRSTPEIRELIEMVNRADSLAGDES